MTAEIVLWLIAAPVLAFVLFRAASFGWYSGKWWYQRRLISGIKERKNGQSSSKST